MKEDYLWDKSGAPDPEVERLEKLLGGFRHHGKEPQWSDPRRRAVLSKRVLAIAAMLVVAVAAGWLGNYVLRDGWKVERLAGTPKIEGSALSGVGVLRVGQTLETDATSRAELSVGQIGFLQVEPGTRLNLLRSRPQEHRVYLDHGKIVARIFAPPRLFFVNMSAATAVDLGCAYTLEVEEGGNGRIHVTLGWVGFESDGLESLIPAGAACLTRRGSGPGTPYFLDASDEFIRAVERFDREGRGQADLRIILEQARARDGLTLWHLLTRTSGEDRGAVYDLLARLVPPPRMVTRDGVLQLDRPMLEAWWDQLNLGPTNWWKLWKGPWPGRVK